MKALHFPICALDRCYATFDEHRHLDQAQRFFAFNPRVAAAGAAARRRKQLIRAPAGSASAAAAAAAGTKRRNHAGRHSLTKIAKRPLDMASTQEFVRCTSSPPAGEGEKSLDTVTGLGLVSASSELTSSHLGAAASTVISAHAPPASSDYTPALIPATTALESASALAPAAAVDTTSTRISTTALDSTSTLIPTTTTALDPTSTLIPTATTALDPTSTLIPTTAWDSASVLAPTPAVDSTSVRVPAAAQNSPPCHIPAFVRGPTSAPITTTVPIAAAAMTSAPALIPTPIRGPAIAPVSTSVPIAATAMTSAPAITSPPARGPMTAPICTSVPIAAAAMTCAAAVTSTPVRGPMTAPVLTTVPVAAAAMSSTSGLTPTPIRGPTTAPIASMPVAAAAMTSASALIPVPAVNHAPALIPNPASRPAAPTSSVPAGWEASDRPRQTISPTPAVPLPVSKHGKAHEVVTQQKPNVRRPAQNNSSRNTNAGKMRPPPIPVDAAPVSSSSSEVGAEGGEGEEDNNDDDDDDDDDDVNDNDNDGGDQEQQVENEHEREQEPDRPVRTDPATRAFNRLSLTLPIAQPNSDATRPTPMTTASTPVSLPPTPVNTFTMPIPASVSEFVIAIAAKERRVLDLKEQVAREEAELALLKKQLACTDAMSFGGPVHYFDIGHGGGAATPASDGDVLSPRQSADLERRFHFAQHQATSAQSRRRVLQGGHARTLSLLPPAKSKSEFSVPDEPAVLQNQPRALASADRKVGHPSSRARLAQRASWQPRSYQSSPVVPQIMEDLKSGFRAFVEDIRQITIGDEAMAGPPVHQRNGHAGRRHAGPSNRGAWADLTSRPSRPMTQMQHRSRTAELLAAAAADTPTPAERPKLARGNNTSWTALGLEATDDTDWTSWESPLPAKTARWSGSTITSGIMEDARSVSDSADESATSSKKRPSVDRSPLSVTTNKLEELLPAVVNSLSPGHIKSKANSLLDEWERSLADPTTAEAIADKENVI